VNGSLLTKSESLTGANTAKSATGTLSLTAGDVVRIDLTAPSSGWSYGRFHLGTDSSNSNIIQTVSAGPTSPIVIDNGDSYVLSTTLTSPDWTVQAGIFCGGSSPTIKTHANPQLYVGTWDGTFVYSWSQNPVWIIYDILTNTSYGLGIPEDNIDKYKFYQVAQYCDACDAVTGTFYRRVWSSRWVV
jgi:hypothetical protein